MNSVLSFIAGADGGVSTQDIEQAFPELSLRAIVAELNALAKKKLVDIFKTKAGILYRRNSEAHAFASNEEKIVFLLVKESERDGIWIKDIKTQSGLHQNLVTKILKGLEQRALIKAVKSVKQNRKLYMLYDAVPADSLGDGPWFTADAELDTEFVEAIKGVICEWLLKGAVKGNLAPFDTLPECKDVHMFIAESGVSSVPLAVEDIARLLEILQCEGSVLQLGAKYMRAH